VVHGLAAVVTMGSAFGLLTVVVNIKFGPVSIYLWPCVDVVMSREATHDTWRIATHTLPSPYSDGRCHCAIFRLSGHLCPICRRHRVRTHIPYPGAVALIVAVIYIIVLSVLLRGSERRRTVIVLAVLSVPVGVGADALPDIISMIVIPTLYVVGLLRSARRHSAVVARSAAALAVTLIVMVALYVRSFPRWVVHGDEVQQWIAAEIPRGSNQATVLAVLRRHTVGGETIGESTGPNGVVLSVYIEPNYYDVLCAGQLHIAFYFDHSNRLTHHNIEQRRVCL